MYVQCLPCFIFLSLLISLWVESAWTVPQKLFFLSNLASMMINPTAKIFSYLTSWQHWMQLMKLFLEMLAPLIMGPHLFCFFSYPLDIPSQSSSVVLLLLSFVCFLFHSPKCWYPLGHCSKLSSYPLFLVNSLLSWFNYHLWNSEA